MKDKLICPNCGNTKRFYRTIFTEAKIRVNNTGETLKQIYDIDKEGFSEYEGIYCCECDSEVDDW